MRKPASEGDDTAATENATDPAGGGEVLLPILAACCERGLKLRATVRNSAVAQSARFTPQQLRQIGDWWFAYDDVVGLHFCPSEFVRTKNKTSVDEDGSRLVLYPRTDSQRPSLLLESDDEGQAATWCEILYYLLGYK